MPNTHTKSKFIRKHGCGCKMCKMHKVAAQTAGLGNGKKRTFLWLNNLLRNPPSANRPNKFTAS